MDFLGVITLYLWSIMMVAAPPGRSYLKTTGETAEQGSLRYFEIAKANVRVSFDPNNKPVFGGRYGRVQTALLNQSIALSESAFRKDVDTGVGKWARGDLGKSWGLMQANLGRDPNNTEPLLKLIGEKWSPKDLVEDRVKMFTVGYRMSFKSFSSCSRLPVEQRLSVYTSGTCDSKAGQDASVSRVGRALRWFSRYPSPVKDLEVMGAIEKKVKAGEVW